uniref:Cytochrome P450 n=1 Tax=Physcomitrium patens TaxID=3218 RepID=A0A7I4CGT1_PHYPA
MRRTIEEMVGDVWIWVLITMVVAVIVGVGIDKKTKRGLKLPPGPPAWPVVGCLASLPAGHPPEVMFAKLAEKHGELMLLWLGSKPYVVASSARMAMEFLKRHDQEFANRPMSVVREYVSFKGNSIISMSASDPKYQRLRRTFVMELLSPKKIAATRDLRKDQVLKMLRAIREDLDAKHEANFTEAVLTLGMSLSIGLLFGRDYGGKVFSEEIQTLVLTFKTMVKYLSMINISDLIPSLRWLDLQGIERGLGLGEVQLRKSIMALIEQKRLDKIRLSSDEIESGACQRDILSKLLSLEGEDRLDDDQLMGVVFALMLAGSDSISRGVGRAMQELLKQPLLHQRALDELDEVVGRRRLVEESDISSLPLINNIIKETLRLHPPAQLLIPHGNVEQCEVAGYHIPARSTVLVNLYALSRDPSFWNSPLEFAPDRFVDSNLTVQGSDFHYIPFGYGRRGCPGLNLGGLDYCTV